MRGLDIHKASTVSVTKLTIGIQVGFISSHLSMNKLFPVNQRGIMGPPKISLLLEVKNMPALIIKPKLILVTHTDDLCWNITSTSRERCLFKTSTGLSAGVAVVCVTTAIPGDDTNGGSPVGVANANNYTDTGVLS